MKPGEFLYLKGIYFFVGEFCEDPSPNSGIEYMVKAANLEHKRAKEIVSGSSNLKFEIYLDALNIGASQSFKPKTINHITGSESNLLLDEEKDRLDMAKKSFVEKPCQIKMDKDLMFEIALRYYVGDITGKQSTAKGKTWLDKAKIAGHSEANRISMSPNMLQWAYVDAGETYGSTRAIKKVMEWHRLHRLKIMDDDLIEFAKAVVKQGDIY